MADISNIAKLATTAGANTASSGSLWALGGTVLGTLGLLTQASLLFGPGMQSIYAQQALLEQQASAAKLQGEYAQAMAGLQAKAMEYNAKMAEWEAELSEQIGEYNAQVYEADAEAVEVATAWEVFKLEEAGGQILDRQFMTFSHAGVNPRTGSALDVYADTEHDLALEAAAMEYEGLVKTTKLLNMAEFSRWSGEVGAAKAMAQSVLDTNAAQTYLFSGEVSALMAEIQSDLFSLQSSAMSYSATAQSMQGVASLFTAGASLLTGIGRYSMLRG